MSTGPADLSKFPAIDRENPVRGVEHAIQIRSFLSGCTRQLMPCGIHWLPCWCSAVVLESFPAKRGSVPQGTLSRRFASIQLVPRWRSGRWHQQWPSRFFLFVLALVSQYSIDDVLVLNAGDDPCRTTAAATDLDVDTEHAF